MAKYFVALSIAVLLNASGNLLIRFGVRGFDLVSGKNAFAEGPLGILRLFLRHWGLFAGGGCFVFNLVLYAYALRGLAISTAYPLMVMGAFILIVIVSAGLLEERLTSSQWVGVAAIAVGVILVARDASRQMLPKPREGLRAVARHEEEDHFARSREHDD
jgi:drug/metabolite transporter (DMT)-like permease